MPSPVGLLPAHQALDLLLADVRVHLLDIRSGLGEPSAADCEPEAAAVAHRRSGSPGGGR